MPTNLFCPSCATRNAADQSFCRSCGLNLKKTAESLAEQRGGEVSSHDRSVAALERFGGIVFTGLGISVAAGIIGLLYVIITRMIISGSQPIAGAVLAAFVLFAGLALAFVGWREALADNERRRTRSRRADAIDEGGGEPMGLGEPTFEPVPSVVENTTRRLKVTRDLSGKP
jgi:hypothetical protein